MPLFPLFAILLAGIGLAVQAPTNAALARTAGSTLLAALVSFLVGTGLLLACWAAFDRAGPAALRGAPAWAWFGGAYGAMFVAAMAYASPRLGLATTLTGAIASQLIAAILLDHYGLLGLKVSPIGVGKIAGIVLVLAGVVLIRRG